MNTLFYLLFGLILGLILAVFLVRFLKKHDVDPDSRKIVACGSAIMMTAAWPILAPTLLFIGIIVFVVVKADK